MNEVADESQTVQLGISEDLMFYQFSHNSPVASSWNKYPTKENPSSRYKFTSVEIILHPDKLVSNRQTYSLLDWLGDMGGLFDALRYTCYWIVSPIASFALQSTIMSKLFLF